jgi:hypothetical protein
MLCSPVVRGSRCGSLSGVRSLIVVAGWLIVIVSLRSSGCVGLLALGLWGDCAHRKVKRLA